MVREQMRFDRLSFAGDLACGKSAERGLSAAVISSAYAYNVD